MRPFRTARHWIFLTVALIGAGSCASLSQLNIFTEEEELAMGAQFAAEIDAELDFYEDPVVEAYVDSLGQELVRVSKRNDIPYRFRVVDTDEINAFAVPGGYLYVNRGLIEAADNESELAGVLGHEIGHIVGKHSMRQLTQQYGLSVISQLALGEDPGTIKILAAQIVATGAISHYSRDMESEADSYGAQEVYDLGIHPKGLVTFFRKLEAMRGGDAGDIEKFFSTHPDPGDRADAVLATLAGLRTDHLSEDSARFQAIKARVRNASR